MSNGNSGSDGESGPHGCLWVIVAAIFVFWFLPQIGGCIQRALR